MKTNYYYINCLKKLKFLAWSFKYSTMQPTRKIISNLITHVNWDAACCKIRGIIFCQISTFQIDCVTFVLVDLFDGAFNQEIVVKTIDKRVKRSPIPKKQMPQNL